MELMDYKCPNCSGAIRFDTGIQKMKCPFCRTEFEMETLRDYDNILNGDKKETITWSAPLGSWEEGEREGLSVYSCNSCGGEKHCQNREERVQAQVVRPGEAAGHIGAVQEAGTEAAGVNSS